MIPTRRTFLTGLVAAPAVLRLGLYMPVKKWIEATPFMWGCVEFIPTYENSGLSTLQIEGIIYTGVRVVAVDGIPIDNSRPIKWKIDFKPPASLPTPHKGSSNV
jgi:hypothetical protein